MVDYREILRLNSLDYTNSDIAASVCYDGSVNSDGFNVDRSNGSVRPCVWVRLI